MNAGVSILLLYVVLLVLACLIGRAWFAARARRPEVGRFPSPGSLPRARGFQAAAERHFGEGYDIAWVEEAQTFSQRSLDMLRPTIRKDGAGTVRNLRPGRVVAHTPWPECP